MPIVDNAFFNDYFRLRLRGLLGVDLDKTICDMLAFIIANEPTTLYRISKSTPYGISTVYKKARRMLKDGLIKCAYSGEAGCIYEATVKGLLTCLSYSCLDDMFVLEKLRLKWPGLNVKCLMLLVALLPDALERNDVDRLEDWGYIIERVRQFVNSRPDEALKAIAYVKGFKPLGGNGFLLSIHGFDVIVVNCTLCDMRCFMTRLNDNCPLLKDVYKAVEH